MLLLVSTLILSTVIDAVQVIGGNVTVVQGRTAILPCKLIDSTESLSQITWQRMTRGKAHSDNFFTIVVTSGPPVVKGRDERFKFIGNVSDNNGSLQLSSVTLMDEGTYTCIFTLFPSGNYKTEIPLNLLVPPVTSLKNNHLTLGNEEVLLVTCTAAGSKPPAEVVWLTGTLAGKVRATTNSTQHDNSTTTTVSSLFGVPTREISAHTVQCVVTSAAMTEEETLPFTIQVYFSPMEINISERAEDSFECATESNPHANFTWTRIGQSLPQSAVRVEGATLQFLSMAPHLNGLYQCEAYNPYGRKQGRLYVHVTSSGACPVCWTLFGLLLLLIPIGVVAVWYFYKTGKFLRTGENTRVKRMKGTTTSSTAEEDQGVQEEAVALNTQGST